MPELDDRTLDQWLARAASGVRFPATPSMRGAVLATIAASPGCWRPSPKRPGWPLASWRMAAAAVALALAFALGGIALNPEARTAIGEFFGIVEGQRVGIVANDAPRPTATPALLPDVAVPVTLPEARLLLDFEPGIPEGLGEPEGIYIVEWAEQPLLILQYAELDLWQTHGVGFFGKGPSAADVIEQPLVNGRPAWWIVSDAHETAFFDAGGNEVAGSRRTVESRLLAWNGEDGRYYRMETERSLEGALAIAEALP